MLVNFVKMHGLGNDFVVIDLITQNLKFQTAHIQHIADRHLGIGCDQVILLEPPIKQDRDFFYRIFNADGTEVEQCGNGARCAARFFYDSGFTEHSRTILKANCLAGASELILESDGNVTVNMGKPIFDPERIPMLVDAPSENRRYSLEIENKSLPFFPVSMGNPHMVLHVTSVETAPVSDLGPFLATHSQFPAGVNVGFMEVIDPQHLRLRVYERGVGETLACGSGAAAAVVAGIHQDLLISPVTVSFAKGDLQLSWAGNDQPVYMTGPTASVFMGRFCLS